MHDRETLVPDFQVLCDGTKVLGKEDRSLISLTVDFSDKLADMFRLRLDNDGFRWSDGGIFSDGVKICLDLGYLGRLIRVFDGEVTNLEAGFPRRGPATLTVAAYGRRHRMRRSRKSRSFLGQKDSAIASKIAAEYGLSAEIDDSGIVYPYLFQNNQSDLDFLRERARQIGFVFSVCGEVLFFKKPSLGATERVVLKWGENLRQFHPSLSLASQFSGVEVRAWDIREKKEIVARAERAQLQSAMGGASTGLQMVEKALGHGSEQVIVDRPVSSQSEADSLARAALNERARGFVSGGGVCAGNPKLKVGAVVELAGCGEIFSGLYLLTAVRHQLSPEGLTTEFAVSRTSIGTEVESPKPAPTPAKPRDLLADVASEDEPPKPILTNARWSREKVEEGKLVNMLVEAYHFGEKAVASFKVYHRGKDGKTRFVEERTSSVQNDGASESFSYSYQEGCELQPADFFFKVKVGTLEANSDFLKVRNQTLLDFSLANTDIPLAGALFVAHFPDGSTVRGRLDEEGKARLPEMSPGKFNVEFPEFEQIQKRV